MKATFTTRELKDALKTLGVMKKDRDINSLRITLTAEHCRLFVERNSDKVNATIAIPANVEYEGAVQTSLADLSKILRFVKDDIAMLETIDDGAKFVTNDDSFRLDCRLLEMPPDNSKISTLRYDTSIPQIQFKYLMQAALPALNPDPDVDRAFKHHCRLKISDGILTLAASDSYRIVYIKDKAVAGKPELEYIIPYNMMLVAAKECYDTGDVALSLKDDRLCIGFDNITLRAEKPTCEMPAFEKIFDDLNNPVASVVCDVTELEEKVKRFKTLLGRKQSLGLRMEATNDALSLSVADEAGKSLGDTKIVCGLEGKPLSWKINAGFLLDALDVIIGNAVRLSVFMKKNCRNISVNITVTGKTPFDEFTGVIAGIVNRDEDMKKAVDEIKKEMEE